MAKVKIKLRWLSSGLRKIRAYFRVRKCTKSYNRQLNMRRLTMTQEELDVFVNELLEQSNE